MPSTAPIQVLFTGYAPVHFACFRPLHDQLVARNDVEVFLSGGLRTKTAHGVQHDERALYCSFNVAAGSILPLEEIEDRSFDVLFAANTKMMAPGHVGARVQIFHGISFRNKAVRRENMNADYYFMVGPYMQRRFVQSGLMHEDDPRALPVGFLKTDRLLNGTLDRSRLLADHGFDGSRPVILYAPTGQRYNSLETMGFDVIRNLIEADRYDVIVKPHDHPKNTKINWFERLAPLAGPHVNVSRELDVIPLLFMADLLITDASSVSSEYSLLDRPIVFLDVPQLLEKAGKSTDSQLDLDSWGRHVGPVVPAAEQIVQAVETSLNAPGRFGVERRAMAADLFHNPGRSVDHAMEWFTSTFLSVTNRVHITADRVGELKASTPIPPRIRFKRNPAFNGRPADAARAHVTAPRGDTQ